MPRLILMSTLITRCQQRADKVGDDHIGGTDTLEWYRLISEVYGADVYQVVADTGLRYFETTTTLTTSGAAYVSEPAAVAKTIRLDYIDSAGTRYRVQPAGLHDQVWLDALTGTYARFFAVVDDRIYLYPTPATGQTYELLYIPQAPDLTTYVSSDSLDVVSSDGEACIIWGVAGLAKIKSSQDASIFLQKQAEHRNRLEAWAADRLIAYAQIRPAADEYCERYGDDEGNW